jgi:hypothetical protein
LSEICLIEIALVANRTNWFGVLECVLLPMIGLVSLILVHTCDEKTRVFAERQFLATLIFVTFMTLRTVISLEPTWLIHTGTLGTMVIAALVTPAQYSETV